MLGVAATFAGCKDKESLVIVTLTTSADDPSLATATISVGTQSETFDLKPDGVPATGVSFGVYVPSSIKGKQTITVVASPAQAGNCNGANRQRYQVDIATVGEPYGPILIALSPSTTACTGSGGATGTGGGNSDRGSGAAGTSGAAGGSGTGGRAGSGGSGGRAGATGTGGAGGHAGAAGTGGSGGRAGAPGTGGTAGAGAMGGGSGTPKGISACFEYDHSTNGTCEASCSSGTSIYGAAFSPKNPGLAVTSGTDGRTKVWTVANGSMVAAGPVLTGGADGLVSFSPDGTLLAIGLDGGVQIVNTSSWAVVRTLTVANIVYGVAFSPDGSQIVTLTTDSSASPPASHLYVHAVTSITPSQTIALIDGWAMAVSPAVVGGALPVAVTTTTGSVLLYNLSAAGFGSPTTVAVTSDQSTVETAAFSPIGTVLAAGGQDGYLRFWSIPLTGAAQPTTINVYGATNSSSSVLDAVAFSPDGGELAVGGGSAGSVTTFATAARTQVGVGQYTSSGADVTVLGYSPDGNWIIGGEYACGCVFLCKH